MDRTALTSVLEALEYSGDNGLVTTDAVDVEDERAYLLQEIRDKFDLDAVFFHGNVPIVYFKEFQTVNDDDLLEFHRSLWNHNRAPLFVTVFPQEVRVYNCFASPPRDSNSASSENPVLLKRVINQVAGALALGSALSEYHRSEIESGRFVQAHHGRFNREQRVDTYLLHNLRHVRASLLKDGLSESVATNLMGRSIFIRYLEDRGAVGGKYCKQFSSGDSFCKVLEESLDGTYRLFDDLNHRFNGDMFPVDDLERNQVKSRHLQRLGEFLRGDVDPSGQMYFWAYDFQYIPTELISAIYETFLDGEQGDSGAYYTPPEVVDLVLNDMLPFDMNAQDVKILDPACGSGIFLVEAYRRLVILYRKARAGEKLGFKELCNLLTESIYGVDMNENAIQVAAFSCYLALLDFVEPKSIWEDVRFPKLKGTNLFVNDFFDTGAEFNNYYYDIIVGNPPWGSQATSPANSYVEQHRLITGNKEIAQAFLWRAPTLLADGGRVCLLAPSKGMLFNQSGPNREFRRQFFTDHEVTKVVDFSALRRSLFHNANAPMVAIFFQKPSSTNDKRDELTYLRLHQSPLSEGLAGIVVYGDEIRRMSYGQIFKHLHIWKIALWGTPRDFILVNELSERFPSLEDVCKFHGWKTGKGVAKGKQTEHRPDLAKMRYVPPRAVKPFCVSSKQNERINHEWFERARDTELYLGPHVLIRTGVRAGGFLSAAFLSEDAVFESSIIGVAGPSKEKDDLKIVSAYINSSLARYYLFLTSSRWGVERDEILLTEYRDFPCAIPTNNTGIVSKIVSLVDKLQQDGDNWNWQSELDELVYSSYGVTPSERQIIEDTVKTTIERYYERLRANAFKKPSEENLVSYAEAYSDVFSKITGGSRALQPKVYSGDSPYRVVSFTLTKRGVPGERPSVASRPELDALLVRLSEVLIEQKSRSLYFRRNMTVFGPDDIHIMKPAERRFWTKSSAFNDADETIAQLLKTAPLGNSEEAMDLT